MPVTTKGWARRAALAAAALLALGAIAVAGRASANPKPKDDVLNRNPTFYVERQTNAGRQAEIWAAQGRQADAAYMRALAGIPQAVWFTTGPPAQVRAAVHATMVEAMKQHATPVLVAYYVPGRDCS